MKRRKNKKKYSNDQRNDKEQKKEKEYSNNLINVNEQKNEDEQRVKNEKENGKSKDIKNEKQKSNSKIETKSFDIKVEGISEQQQKSKNTGKGNSNDQNILLDIKNSTIQENLNKKSNENKEEKMKQKSEDNNKQIEEGKQNQKEEMEQKETDKSNEIEKDIKEVDQSKIDECNQRVNSIEIIIQIMIILQSNSLSEIEKEISLQQINQNLNKSQLDELEKIKYFPEFQLILTYFDKFNSQIEKILLDIIEIFINCGDQQYQDNIFFQPIDESRLLEKIINQIKYLVKEEENNKQIKQYSDMLEQLFRIYLKIQKKPYYEKEIIDSYIRILDMNIGYFIKTLRSNSKVNEKQKNNQLVIEEYLKRLSQQIHSIDLIKDYSWNISYESTRLYRERILSLIHINCPKELHCPHQIILPDSPYIQQFIAEILYSIIVFCTLRPTFLEQIQDQHNIFFHLSSLFNCFINSKKIQKQENYIRYQQILVIPPSQILRSLKLLNDFLQQHNLSKKYLAQIPDLFSSILNILKHKFDLNAIKEGEINNISDIICKSLKCISQIQNNNNNIEIQMQLSKIVYVHSLISIISTSNEQNQLPIERALTYNKKIILLIHKITSKQQQQSSSKQQILLKSSGEQFEEEGANEEISAYFVCKSKKAKKEALEIYQMILNHYNSKKVKQNTWDDYSSSNNNDNSSSSSSSDSFEDDKLV